MLAINYQQKQTSNKKLFTSHTNKSQHHLLVKNKYSKQTVKPREYYQQIEELNPVSIQYIFDHSINQQDKRWLLLINPTENDVNELMNSHKIAPQKILKVYTKNSAISQSNIEHTLLKGNCNSVIFYKNNVQNFNSTQLMQVASQGNTQCIIINKGKCTH